MDFIYFFSNSTPFNVIYFVPRRVDQRSMPFHEQMGFYGYCQTQCLLMGFLAHNPIVERN